ncbi:MAG: hypothetical protein M3439_08230 [Chloroflexota bacterium]|nr:hypothetical protein [Chloroflexota bacterium]
MAHWKSHAVCVLALALLLTGCGGQANAPSGATATSGRAGSLNELQPLTAGRDVLAPDGRYSLRVSGEWVRYDDPIAELAFRTVAEDPALALNVVREDIGDNPRVQVYAEEARDRIGSIYRNVISLSLSPVRIGALEAYRWIYTASIGEQERLFYQVYLVDGGQGFVLTGSAPITADLPTISSTFDAIAGSMTFARG